MSETTGGHDPGGRRAGEKVQAGQRSHALPWVETENGYGIALEGRELAFRNPRGKRLQAVPREVRASGVAEQLTALRDWLDGHEIRCRRAVEDWMLLAVPLPRAALEAAWRDPDWRRALHGVLVRVEAPEDPDFLPDSRHGLLVDVDAERGVELIDADAARVCFDAVCAVALHPLATPDLDSWRALAAEHAIEQGVPQLRRSLHGPAKRRTSTGTETTEFAGGVFARQGMVDERCRLMGYESLHGEALCAVQEEGKIVEARYWIGAGAPEERAITGRLTWVDRRGRGLPLARVGRIAWSEGVRMAESIYTGRSSKGSATRRRSS